MARNIAVGVALLIQSASCSLYSTEPTYISSGDAQPRPQEDYFGLSLSYFWTRSTIGPNAPLFEDTPGWSNSTASHRATLVAPISVTVNSPREGPRTTHEVGKAVPRREYISGKCTLPEPVPGTASPVYGAHVWMANLLYSEQIAWPFDVFVTAFESTTPAERDYHFAIPLYSMMESLDHFMSSKVPVCGNGITGVCPTLTEDPDFRFLEHSPPTDFDVDGIPQSQTPYLPYFYWDASSTLPPPTKLLPFLAQGSTSPHAGFTQHSFSSFSAGHWVVMCSAFAVDDATGRLQSSTYTPHASLDEYIDGNGRYVNAFDDKYKRAGSSATFWSNDGDDGANVGSGRFGDELISTNLSFTPDVCWRETNSRGVALYLGSFAGYVPAAGIRGQPLLNVIEYTQHYSDEHFSGAWIPSDGDSNADLVGDGGDPTFVNQRVQTAARITYCDNHDTIRNAPSCLASPPSCSTCAVPGQPTGNKVLSPPLFVLPFDERGPGMCYFALPNTWGAEPSELAVRIRGAGFAEFELEARYDGKLFEKWAVTDMEFYIADAALSVLVPITGTAILPGHTVKLPNVFTAPVGIRQTVMVRLRVNRADEIELYPSGPFSPWAVRHFVIPKFQSPPPWLRPPYVESTPASHDVNVFAGFPFTLRARDFFGKVEDPLFLHDFDTLVFEFSVAEAVALELGGPISGRSDDFSPARIQLNPNDVLVNNWGLSSTALVSFIPRQVHRYYVVRITVTLDGTHSATAPRRPDGSLDLTRGEGAASFSFDFFIGSLPCQQCPEDSLILTECSSSADATCSGSGTSGSLGWCSAGDYISHYSQHAANIVCEPCSSCASGTYAVLGSCAGQEDTKCAVCTPAAADFFVSSGCDGVIDSVFAQCPTLSFDVGNTFALLPPGCPLVINAQIIATGLGLAGFNLTEIRDAAAAAAAQNVSGAALQETLRVAGFDIAALQASASTAAAVATAASNAAAAALAFSNSTVIALTDALRAAGEAAGAADAVISLNISILQSDFAAAIASAARADANSADALALNVSTLRGEISAAMAAAAAASSAAASSANALALNVTTLRGEISAATNADAIFALLTLSGYNLTAITAHAAAAAAAASAATALSLAASNISGTGIIAALSSAGFDLAAMTRDTSAAASAASAAAAAAARNISGATLVDTLEASGFNLSNIAALTVLSRSSLSEATSAAAAAAAASAAASNGSMIAVALAAAGFDLRFADATVAAAAASAAAASAAAAVDAAVSSAANVSAPALLLTLATAGFNLTALFSAIPAGVARSFSICSVCTSAEYATRNCTLSADTLCAPCPACAASEFETTPCTKYSPRACTACLSAADCSAGSYLVPCSPHAQGVCRPWTLTCPANSFRLSAASPTSDLACSPCECGEGAAACDSLTGACFCKATFTGARCDACIEGWFGERCDQRCACDAAGAATPACSRESGICACKPRFAGYFCDRCNTTLSGVERFGADCDGVCACASTGTCVSGRRGNGACACEPGWAGRTCATQINVSGADAPCPLDDSGKLCSGTGVCDALTGACVCAAGYGGETCSPLSVSPLSISAAPPPDATLAPGSDGFSGVIAGCSVVVTLSVVGLWRIWRRRNATPLTSPLASPSSHLSFSSETMGGERARDPSMFNRLLVYARSARGGSLLRGARAAAASSSPSPTSTLSIPTLPLRSYVNSDQLQLESAREFASPRGVLVLDDDGGGGAGGGGGGGESARERFAAVARRRARSNESLIGGGASMYSDPMSGRRIGSPTSTVRLRTPRK